jgi:hypothetical protein
MLRTLLLPCFDVDETQTKRCEKHDKKIKITRINIYNKQSIKELQSTCTNLSSTTSASPSNTYRPRNLIIGSPWPSSVCVFMYSKRCASALRPWSAGLYCCHRRLRPKKKSRTYESHLAHQKSLSCFALRIVQYQYYQVEADKDLVYFSIEKEIRKLDKGQSF